MHVRGRTKPKVTMAQIRKLVREIAGRFEPEKIILFGSYAYGKPDGDSDVDLLVVMPAWNEISKAIRIYQTLDTPFSLDLIVRTPERLRRRLEWGDWFLREIMTRGKVLYEKAHSRLGSQSRGRLQSRARTSQRKVRSK